MTAFIGDYVTTGGGTYEMVRTFDGVPYFNLVGTRQGILTGRFFSRFDTELSRLDCILYEVLGTSGTLYGVPSLNDLVVVNNPDLGTLKTIEDLYETCFPMQMMRLLERTFHAAQYEGAIHFDNEVKDWSEYRLHVQEEFFKAYIATGRQAVGKR